MHLRRVQSLDGFAARFAHSADGILIRHGTALRHPAACRARSHRRVTPPRPARLPGPNVGRAAAFKGIVNSEEWRNAEMGTRLKFADVVLDIDEVVALVGGMVFLRDGREVGIGEKAADALMKATPPFPELPQDTCDKARKASRCSSKQPVRHASRSSKAQAQLQRHSS